MKKLVAIIIAISTSVAFAQGVSQLYEEFVKRDEKKLTQEQGAAIQFLKTLNYETKNIVELDILNPTTTFVFRDRSGDICYGDSVSLILRCKNEMGLTSISFDGDAD